MIRVNSSLCNILPTFTLIMKSIVTIKNMWYLLYTNNYISKYNLKPNIFHTEWVRSLRMFSYVMELERHVPTFDSHSMI